MHEGAVDEYVWPTALTARGFLQHPHGLTYVDWGPKTYTFKEPQSLADLEAGPGADPGARRRFVGLFRGTIGLEVDVTAHGLPTAFTNKSLAASAISKGRATGKLFGRKFLATDDVTGELLRSL